MAPARAVVAGRRIGPPPARNAAATRLQLRKQRLRGCVPTKPGTARGGALLAFALHKRLP